MIIDRLGTRPGQSKTCVITQLSRPTMVEDVRVLMGMTRYFWQFVPDYSMVGATISDLLRDPRFKTKRARRYVIPSGEERNKGFRALTKAFVTPDYVPAYVERDVPVTH